MALTNSWKLLTYLQPSRKNTSVTINAHRKRIRLTHKCLKNRTETNKVCYNKQRNFCVNLLQI